MNTKSNQSNTSQASAQPATAAQAAQANDANQPNVGVMPNLAQDEQDPQTADMVQEAATQWLQKIAPHMTAQAVQDGNEIVLTLTSQFGPSRHKIPADGLTKGKLRDELQRVREELKI